MVTDNGKLKLSATNLEIGIVTWIAANVVEDGGITLPSRTLNDLVAALPKDQVDMALTQRTQTLNLCAGRTEANIKGINMQDMPVVHCPDPDEYPISLSAKQLSTAIRQVVIAAATEDNRPILTGVLMKFDDSSLTMAAADGFRLSVRSIPITYVGDPFEVIVPARALGQVARLCKDVETVDFYHGHLANTRVMFKFGHTVLTSQLIDGNFPDYRQIIPKDHTTKTEVETAALLKMCKAALIFARDSAHISRLKAQPGDGNGTSPLLTLTAISAETGDSVNQLDAVIDGDEIEVAFNIKYLIDFLSAVKTPKLSMETTTHSQPGAFRPVGDEDYIHILMPMHLGR
ncbi:MAG: DNA polymerase III subunit beta [Chloroflexi bacterium]|nr:DNA polymerase III subunit beta [Chloroflexota bacterium]